MKINAVPEQIRRRVEQYGQQHLLRWWDELYAVDSEQLAEQIGAVDFEAIDRVWRKSKESMRASGSGTRAEKAQSPRSVVFQPASEDDRRRREHWAEVGRNLLAEGKVAVITVAGGQGSRLGFDQPKGMYPIGPVSQCSLFQIFAEQITARIHRHGGSIPWLIMTSAATHLDTVGFFEAQQYFGLDPSTVFFFQQGSMPAVDAETGRLLMSDRATLCQSPDGHGGLVMALKNSGLLEKLSESCVEHLFYHQVDNPTVVMCDPVLLGVHAEMDSQMTTNVVRKRTPTERMGVLVEIDGRTEIIEYSELNEEQASRVDHEGNSVFWAGNTAIHVLTRSFMEELTEDGCRLELHAAHKAVPYLDDEGQRVDPSEPNAIKFERFIFDALPLAKNALIVEGDRDREFNPVKNADGNDSPETARAAISRIGREWLRAAGADIADDAVVEISPLIALDAEELAEKLASGEVTVESLSR